MKTKILRLAQTSVLALVLIGATGNFSEIIAIGESRTDPDSLLGNYLAGRYAKGQRDTSIAADFFAKVLAKDPDNELILEQTLMLAAAGGNWRHALNLADVVVKSEPTHRVSRYLLAVKAFKDGDYAAADQHLSKVRKGPIAGLTTRLAQAWIKLAQKKPDDALALLGKGRKVAWSKFYQRYHQGLIADLAGKTSLAGDAFSAAFKRNPRTLRISQAYARHAAHGGETKLARQILTSHIKRSGGHPLSRHLLEQVKKGAKIDFLIKNPAEGLAEVFYGIGDALTGEGGVETGTIYLQLALFLRDDFPLASVALGEVYESSEKYDRAVQVYDAIAKSSPLWMNSQIRKAFSFNSLERVDDAKALLETLAEAFPTETRPLNALGNILRSHKRFAEAVTFYSRAIAILKQPQKSDWRLFYARGVCNERLKDWKSAEADLKKAVELDGNRSLVLNYLGYSWVDQGMHIKEAMALIRKAVKLKPDDGYYVDSLGWAHYRLGHYQDAVKHLERAVELRPDDPVINDHLGDAYWQVDRRTEAKFQWSQSLDLKPEPADVEKIKAKLAEGLKTPKQTKAEADAPAPADGIKN